MEENDEDSFNEEDYDPEKVEGMREKRRRLATLQRELRPTLEGARQIEGKSGGFGSGQRSKAEDIETLVLSGVQSAKVYRGRIKEAAGEVGDARRDGRKEVVPPISAGQGADNQGTAIASTTATRQDCHRIEGRWETAEDRDQKAMLAIDVQRKQNDIKRAEAELQKHTTVLREVIHANTQIQQQDALQAQQELEVMALQAAKAHSIGNETEQQRSDLQRYWYEVLQTAAKDMATKLAAPLRVLPPRVANDGKDDRRRWVRNQAARTQSPRVSSSSSSSSGMHLENPEAARRRKDKARRKTSRSPRGRRGRALTRDL